MSGVLPEDTFELDLAFAKTLANIPPGRAVKLHTIEYGEWACMRWEDFEHLMQMANVKIVPRQQQDLVKNALERIAKGGA